MFVKLSCEKMLFLKLIVYYEVSNMQIVNNW